MRERRQFLADQYHFLAEMIFISIIVLIPIHYYYDWIWAWSTFLPAIPLCVIFLLLEVKGVEYKRYYFIVPFLFAAYLLLKFPVFMSLVLSVIVIWRYLRIRHLLVSGRETLYIFMTGMVSLLVYFITSDTMAIIFMFFQLVILSFGFMYSHVAVMEKNRNRWFVFRSSFTFLAFLFLGGLVAFWISTQPFFVEAWSNLMYAILSVLGRVTYLFQFLMDFFSNLMEGRGTSNQLSRFEQPEFEEGGFNLISLLGMSYFMIGVGLALVCLIILISIFRRDTSAHEGIGKRGIIGTVMKELATYSNVIKRMTYTKFGKKHPVRKLIHEFERKAIKNKIERKRSETLREWFNRIGLQIDIDIYQKVRYGKMDVTEQEVRQLERELKHYKEQIDINDR